MPAPLTGSCLCGAIRYTVSTPVTELRACHCTHCQKTSGAGGSVNLPLSSARPWSHIDPASQQIPGQPN